MPIKIKSNSDGSVVIVEIMDTSLYLSDPKYRAVAYSARHAVRDCSTLPLPANKYVSLKTLCLILIHLLLTKTNSKFKNIRVLRI